MTTLLELDAEFVTYHKSETGQVSHGKVDKIEDAQGVMFLCPLCWRTNNGPRGTHMVLCWDGERGVPADAFPFPGRWKMVGTGLHDLTLDASPGKTRSVLLTAGCRWHGFVTDGDTSIC
jgi:hypothetical protein